MFRGPVRHDELSAWVARVIIMARQLGLGRRGF